jgi:hypothetical protein
MTSDDTQIHEAVRLWEQKQRVVLSKTGKVEEGRKNNILVFGLEEERSER